MSISMVDVDEIEGKSSDMIIQKQIVASSQLLDKVTQLKHQIDDGELDGKSALYSEIQSTMMSTGK
jgi:anti-sigma28 factor (negative regulator of flagellin synthesis)